MAMTQIDTVRKMLAGGKILTAKDFSAAGVNPASLKRAVDEGAAVGYARSVYIAGDDIPWPAHVGLAATTLMNPGGVVCLSSAASYHVLSDDNPSEIWYAVEDGKVKNPISGSRRDPVRTVFWLPQALEYGVETVPIGGVAVRITGRARTVVDMLRYRSKMGDETAMKAMKDFLAEGGDLRETWDIAAKLGVLRQVEPFLRLAEEMQPALPRPMR
jgi:predicted transcriptional regulator of viral defense system